MVGTYWIEEESSVVITYNIKEAWVIACLVQQSQSPARQESLMVIVRIIMYLQMSVAIQAPRVYIAVPKPLFSPPDIFDWENHDN